MDAVKKLPFINLTNGFYAKPTF